MIASIVNDVSIGSKESELVDVVEWSCETCDGEKAEDFAFGIIVGEWVAC